MRIGRRRMKGEAAPTIDVDTGKKVKARRIGGT
jgi:hypothetical protein